MIIHIDTWKAWQGGQQQAFYLHQYLCENKIKSVMICKSGTPMALKCQEKKLPYKTLPLLAEIDFLSAIRIAIFAKRNQAKILHLHTAHAISIGLLAKFFYRKTKVIAVKRVDFPIRKNFLSRLKYNNSLLDVLVCISKNIYNVVVNGGFAANRLRMIYSGIDTNRYKLPDENYKMEVRQQLFSQYNIPSHHTIIGTVATFTGRKDYPTLLRAAKIVIENNPDITFVALGEGDDKEKILEIRKELQLENRFILAGFQDDVKKYLHFYDIFVLASKLEGLGTSVLDAMSAQKPIVACNSGGIPEMIQHEQNGLLAEAENPADLAEKLLRMVNDQELRKRLALQAEIDVKEFSIENTIRQNIELYSRHG